MLLSWDKRAGRVAGLAITIAVALCAARLHADVEAGADAWSRGDYTAAVREWEAPAASGDPDALFNLAQAYRFGRGVSPDLGRAEALYARAAAAGHSRAADSYGLLLFEVGRREAAMPYLRHAATRGDARAQYLLGIAHFNGDFVELDWPRAYALMTLANAAGLPQAAPALAEMDQAIPLAQRRQASALAAQLRAAAPAEMPASPIDGRWLIQLGAFSVPSNAEALWNRVAGRAELAGARRVTKASGRLTVLQAGGFDSREAAATACAALKRSGHDCLVTDH